MTYQYIMESDNVFTIDTNMAGFDHYMSCYLVKGKELAMVDTGHPHKYEFVKAAIKKYGFPISDIRYIFLTHCEHGDHSGNVTAILKDAPNARVYFNKIGAWFLLEDAATQLERIKHRLPPELIAVFGEKQPVPADRMVFVNEGDVFDLGNGTKLKMIFAPGHQPSGIAILEEKNMGLFIDDLVGNYFSDADCCITLTPYDTNLQQTIDSLKKLMKLPVKQLFMGHFGISDNPQYVMQRALDGMENLMAIGAQCAAEGKLNEMEARITASKMPEIERLRKVRGEAIYKYTLEELLPHQATAFTKYYIKNYVNNRNLSHKNKSN